jgi:ABC-type glycerol-3-phosphate transport system permease component
VIGGRSAISIAFATKTASGGLNRLARLATAIIYALPPAALYYAARKDMVSGLVSGATKS